MSYQEQFEALLADRVEGRLLTPLARYGSLVMEANQRFNLTGAKSAEEFAPHILDSLTVVPYVEGPLVDVGSGAGLPAIPAALALGIRFTLVETTLKKVRFLESLVESFGLDGEVVAARAETAAHEERLRGRFRSATARAVSTAPTVAELLLPFLEPGGVAVLQRGVLDVRERDAVSDAALALGGLFEREIPLDGERRLLLLRKTQATAHRFPRRVGIPEKRPLCM